ncbi:MAG: nitroreductase family deazaflavin-dependent oxidoreductase [Candidatus Binatia bacterium]
MPSANSRREIGKPQSLELAFFRTLNRLVEPRVRAGWGSHCLVPGGLIVLETTGRRTGRRSRIPLAALRIQGHVVVSTIRGERSAWVKNVSANGDVRYWLRGRPRQATARVISGRQPLTADQRWPLPVRLFVRSLAPYTRTGWTFAVLSPAAATEEMV